MSEKPPKKKLRQASITDMFRATKDKETDVMAASGNDKKREEHFLKSESDTCLKKGTASSSYNQENIEDKDMEWEEFPQLPEDQLFNEDGHPATDKSPTKIVKKYSAGKSKKKKKHADEPRVKGSSSSRDGDHKCSWNTLRDNSDSKNNASEISKKSSDISPSKIAWRGCPLSNLKALSVSDQIMPTVHLSSDHSVMVKVPLTPSELPEPHPSMYSDIWDQYHVRMPCSPKSLYPVAGHGSDSLVPRWSVITKALQRTIRSVKDLQRAILEYNSRYAEKWNFKGLQHLLEEEFEEEERLYFFDETLPNIINLALDLPNLMTLPPPLLTRHSTHSITLSQIQIASLLANAFFCTFPRRNAKGGDTEYASYPDINFNRLYFHKEQRSLEKLKCLLNYFRRVTKKRPDGLVTFSRQHISWSDLPKWETSAHHLPELHISSTGLIEEMRGLLQVDFANKYLGGGVLGLGCVQEEIRFVLSPELLVSRLFTQALDKTEALIITGTELFNCSSGYASTFCWTGSYQDTTPRDTWRRRLCQVVAIDALHFSQQKAQYKPNLILRELNKAYAGFRVLKGGTGIPIGVATGNWGCGAFNGNPRLKSLIQLAACGYSGRDVAYFTFGDEKLRNDIATMHIFLRENNVTVGELVQVVVQYGQREWSDGSDLYEYIYHNLGAYESDTDNENEETKGSSSSSTEKQKTSPQKLSTRDYEKPSRSISDYFKRTEAHQSASLQGNEEYSNGNHQLAAVPKSAEKIKEGNLTEEKIEQVLKECDRLVEDRKKKNQENSSGKVEKHIDSNIICYNSDKNDDTKPEANIISEESKKEKIERDIIKTSKSSSEPVNLLSCLDKIDKQTLSQT